MSCIHSRFFIHLITSVLVFAGFAVSSSAQTATFTRHSFAYNKYQTIVAHGDFNNDGREDFIMLTVDDSVQPAVFAHQIYLSNADGNYNSPLPVEAPPNSVIVVGDFNHDGNLDYATSGVTGSSGQISEMHIYLGNGNGSFQPKHVIAGENASVDGFVAADLNHDGKTDLVQVLTPPNCCGPAVSTLQAWISNGDGTFTAGQRIMSVQNELGPLLSGDFDGDGKTDIAITFGFQNLTQVQVWYGDGAGHLGSPFQLTGPSETMSFSAGDINNDGRTDLIGSLFAYGSSGTSSATKTLGAFIGNSNRTLTFKTIATSNCTSFFSPVAVADFNGNGVNDIVFIEQDCNATTDQTNVVMMPGTGGGNFALEQLVYSSPHSAARDMAAVRASVDTKPDLGFTEALAVGGGFPPTALTVMVNSTSVGGFPGCSAPNSVKGVKVCAPSSTAASPVRFSIGGSGDTAMRKVEVWADGHKVAEQLAHAFSDYSFLDAAVPLTSGSHSMTVYAVGWDDSLEKKTFTLNVSGTGCPAPSSAGINVCSPVNGSTVSSPVHALASSTVTGTLARMELWVDGVKRFTTTSRTLDTSVALAAGSHRFSFYAVNTAGTKLNKVVFVTVH